MIDYYRKIGHHVKGAISGTAIGTVISLLSVFVVL